MRGYRQRTSNVIDDICMFAETCWQTAVKQANDARRRIVLRYMTCLYIWQLSVYDDIKQR